MYVSMYMCVRKYEMHTKHTTYRTRCSKQVAARLKQTLCKAKPQLRTTIVQNILLSSSWQYAQQIRTIKSRVCVYSWLHAYIYAVCFCVYVCCVSVFVYVYVFAYICTHNIYMCAGVWENDAQNPLATASFRFAWGFGFRQISCKLPHASLPTA